MRLSALRRIASGIALLAAAPAVAALGGAHVSIEDDRAHLGAAMASASIRVGRVAMLQPGNGGTIREYSNADGVVFAVSWRGRARPDLRQLLGDRFTTAAAEMGRAAGRRTGRMMVVRQPELVIRSEGRPGAFSGFAYDPRLVPAGFALDDLE